MSGLRLQLGGLISSYVSGGKVPLGRYQGPPFSAEAVDRAGNRPSEPHHLTASFLFGAAALSGILLPVHSSTLSVLATGHLSTPAMNSPRVSAKGELALPCRIQICRENHANRKHLGWNKENYPRVLQTRTNYPQPAALPSHGLKKKHLSA